MIKCYTNGLSKYFYWALRENNKSMSVEDAEEKRNKIQKENDNIQKIITKCRNITTIKQIIEHSVALFNVGNNFCFNQNKYIIQHRNCVYDLERNEFKPSSPLYYTSQTTNITIGEERDEEKIEYVKAIIESIFYNEPVNKSNYMEFLSTCLYGETLEKIFIATGSGGNGKGVLNDFMMHMLNQDINLGYSYNAPTHIFQSLLKGGASPELFNMNNKRFVRTAEPSKEKNYNSSFLKELTGGCLINARELYSGNTNCNINLSLVIEANYKVKFDTFCGGIGRRLIPINFNSIFRDDEEPNVELRIFARNPYYKSLDFKKKYMEALFYILTDYWKSYQQRNYTFEHNEEVKENIKDYAIISDEFTEWVNTTYTITIDNDDYVRAKDMFVCYKQSEYYSNLSKKNKRTHNKKWLLEKIKCNPIYGKMHRVRVKKDGATLRNVVLNLVKKY